MNVFFDDKPLGERTRPRQELMAEAQRYLKTVTEKLLAAEAALKTGTAADPGAINEIFRCAHNLKSMGGFCGLTELQQLSHQIEDQLADIRQGKARLDMPAIETAFALHDKIEKLTQEYAALGEASAAEFVTRRGFPPPEQETVLSDEKENSEQGAHEANEPPVHTAPPPPPAQSPEPATQAENKPDQPAPSAPETPQAPRASAQAINPAMLAKFVEDAENGIENFNDVLLRCEKAPATEDMINELFRAAHNLKSTAGFIGAAELARTAHAMEDLLAHFRKNTQSPDAESLNILFEGIDLVRDMVQLYKTGTATAIDATPFLNRMNARYTALTGAPRASVMAAAQAKTAQVAGTLELSRDMLKTALEELSQGRKVFKIAAEIPGGIPVKSINAVMAAKKLGKKGRIIKAVPDADKIVDGSPDAVVITYLFAGPVTEEDVRATLKLSGLQADTIEELSQDYINSTLTGEAGAAVATGIRVDTRKLDRLMDLSGELVTLRSKLSTFQKTFTDQLRRERELSEGVFRAAEAAAALKDALEVPAPDLDTVRANSATVSACLAELCSASDRHEIMSADAVRFDGLLSELTVISGQMQNGVMSSRMVAIEGVFSRFKRIVRDVAKAVNKDVTLIIEGQDTELDKTIVDSLTEPLTHMVRNAVDHGLESTEQRKAAGKPLRGTVSLRAYRMGSSIRVEIRDDGRGMDPEALAASAVRKGVITETQAAELDRAGKLNLIFRPGFSTAETVTGISGRGVGMDVVMSMITSVKGSIDVETAKGRGTAFVLTIPLTLSVIKALLCTVSGVPYALPIDSVHETALVTEDMFGSDEQGPFFFRRDTRIPFFDSHRLMGIPVPEFDQGARMVAILSDGGRKAGIAVHKMLGEEELVIKPLPKHLGHLRGVTGVSVLGSGNVAYILDPIHIISSARK